MTTVTLACLPKQHMYLAYYVRYVCNSLLHHSPAVISFTGPHVRRSILLSNESMVISNFYSESNAHIIKCNPKYCLI